MEIVSCLNGSGKSSQTLKEVPFGCITLYVHKEILRIRNLEVHFRSFSSDEIWEEAKMRNLMNGLKVGTLWNCWPQMQAPSNGFVGELYLRVTMLADFSNKRHGGVAIRGTIPLIAFITSV